MPLAGNVLQSKSRMRHHLYVIHLRGFMFVLPARFLCSIIHERNTICKGFLHIYRNQAIHRHKTKRQRAAQSR